jgi:hypothetical protein
VSRSRKRYALVAGAVALTWLGLLWSRGAIPRGALDPEPDVQARAPRAPAAWVEPPRDRSEPPQYAPLVNADGSARLPELQLADLIHDVELEKEHACPGEDVLVRMHGKPENAAGALPIAELNFNVGGEFGEAVTVSGNAPGVRELTAVASNGVDKIAYRPFQLTVLEPDAPECRDRPYATVEVALDRGDPQAIEARVVATHGLQGRLSYEWDFGDGARAETQEPFASHSYALRDQTRTLSTYLVTVRAFDERGRMAQGRDSIHLSNNHFRARAFGDRLVPVFYSPFPQPAAGGARFAVTFRSIEDDAIAFDKATLTERSCLANREDRVRTIDPAALGVPTRLAAKERREASLLLRDGLIGEDTCVVELELTGDSTPPRTGRAMPGSPIPYREVRTRFTFELLAAPPADQGGASELASRPITDPVLLAKLLQASEGAPGGRLTPAMLEELEKAESAH